MPIIALITVAVLVGIDQYTKYLAVTHLKPISNYPIISNIFELYYTTNNGAAFSILQGQRWFFIVSVSIVCIILCVFYMRLPKAPVYKYVRIALVLILSGALGNFVDRLFRDGSVVDFLRFIPFNFPIFNMADIFVVVGAIGFGILVVFFIKDDKDKKDNSDNNSIRSEADENTDEKSDKKVEA